MPFVLVKANTRVTQQRHADRTGVAEVVPSDSCSLPPDPFHVHLVHVNATLVMTPAADSTDENLVRMVRCAARHEHEHEHASPLVLPADTPNASFKPPPGTSWLPDWVVPSADFARWAASHVCSSKSATYVVTTAGLPVNFSVSETGYGSGSSAVFDFMAAMLAPAACWRSRRPASRNPCLSGHTTPSYTPHTSCLGLGHLQPPPSTMCTIHYMHNAHTRHAPWTMPGHMPHCLLAD